MKLKKAIPLLLIPLFLFTVLATGCGDKKEKEYTVTFNSDGGSIVESQKVKDGKKAYEPEDPTKEGYKFVAWVYNEEEWDFDTKITKNITLKATWEKDDDSSTAKETVKITFDSNGGSSVPEQAVTKGSKISKPSDPTRNEYTFAGWKYGNAIWDFSKTVNDNMTLVAEWNKVSNNEGPNNDGNSGNNNGGGSTKPDPKPVVDPDETAMNDAKINLNNDGVDLFVGENGTKIIGSCRVTWENPSQLFHALSATSQNVNVDIVCGNKRETKTVRGNISPSPYRYTAEMNNNRLNYVIRVSGPNGVVTDYTIYTTAGRSPYLSVGYATIDTEFHNQGNTYRLTFNSDTRETYEIGPQ